MEVGIDIQEINEFKEFKKNKKFYEKVFTKKEILYCLKRKNPLPSFCAKFCVKEAVIKALNKKISFENIEVLNSSSGKPYIKINSKLRKDFLVSLSHSKTHCIGIAFKV